MKRIHYLKLIFAVFALIVLGKAALINLSPDERLQKLDTFTRTTTFERLNEDERSLLLAQASAMVKYSKILGERIKTFNT